MKNYILKSLLLFCILGLVQIHPTNSYFTNSKTLTGNLLTARCWSSPTAPILISPANGVVQRPGSPWMLDPNMDWSNSTTCSNKPVSYIYESYLNFDLTILAYRSGLLSNSIIPAPETPDGSYYWRVRAFDGENWGAWSSAWLLIVDRTPVAKSSQPVTFKIEKVIEPVITELPMIILVPTPTITLTPEPSITPEPTDAPIPTIIPEITDTPIPTPSITPSPTETVTPISNIDGGNI